MGRYLWGVQNLRGNLNETLTINELAENYDTRPLISGDNIYLDISCYRIVNKIGEGGFSIVYRVKNLNINKYYAAKVAKLMIDEFI